MRRLSTLLTAAVGLAIPAMAGKGRVVEIVFTKGEYRAEVTKQFVEVITKNNIESKYVDVEGRTILGMKNLRIPIDAELRQNDGEWLASVWTRAMTYPSPPMCPNPNFSWIQTWWPMFEKNGQRGVGFDRRTMVICPAVIELETPPGETWPVESLFDITDGTQTRNHSASLRWMTRLKRGEDKIRVKPFHVPGTAFHFSSPWQTVDLERGEPVTIPLERDPVAVFRYMDGTCDDAGISVARVTEGVADVVHRGVETIGLDATGREMGILQCFGNWQLQTGVYDITYTGRGQLEVIQIRANERWGDQDRKERTFLADDDWKPLYERNMKRSTFRRLNESVRVEMHPWDILSITASEDKDW